MHRLFVSSSEHRAPGRLHPACLLPLVLLIATSSLLRAQPAPATVTTNAQQINDSAITVNEVFALKATVTTSTGAPVTIGTVTFFEGGVMLGTTRVNASGVATLNYLFPPSHGSYTLTARYNGSTQAGPATSARGFFPAVEAVSVVLAATGNSSGYTLTATANSTNSYPPTGSVEFTNATTGETLGYGTLANATYSSPIDFMPTTGTEVWALGDFNGDGRVDYATQSNGAVTIYFANADGSYAPANSNAAGFLAVGDFNNDGKSDLLALDSSNSLTVLLSQGNGQFTVGGQVPNVKVEAAVVGDFNNDGNLDVLIQPTALSSSQLGFYAGDGAGNLAAAQTANLNSSVTGPALVNDYNNDGHLDFFTFNYSEFWYAGTSLYLGAGDGTTYNQQPQGSFGSYPPASSATAMVSGKFCNSSNVDIAYAAGNTVTILCGDGTGNFHPPANGGTFTYTVPFDPSALVAADINTDGYEDIVAFGSAPGGSPNTPWDMVVFTNSASGMSESAVATSTSGAEGPNGIRFSNTPVVFSDPVIGESLSTSSPYWLMYPFLPAGTTTSETAVLSNVTLPPGNNNIIANYLGSASNTVTLAGGAGGYGGPALDTLALAGNAKVSNGVLQLTDGGSWEAGSGFTLDSYDIQAFTTTFTFQLTDAQADGFTFTIQADGPQVVGGNGGRLGYSDIPNSVALKFDLFDNAGEGSDSTGVFVNGADPTVPATDMTSSGVNLHSGDVMQAQLLYDGANLHVTVTDTATGAVFQHTYAINIPQTIGSTAAHVGFTGATGGLAATENILTWTFEPLPFYPSFSYGPSLFLNGGAAVEGSSNAALVIIDGGTYEAHSAWFANPVPINQFTCDFTFTGSNIAADGLTFAIQSAGTTAVGPAGGGLGYGALTPGGAVGIPNSMAIKFDLYSNAGEGNDSTGIYTNGDSPTVPAIDLSTTPIDLHSGHPIIVHMVYDGSTITMTLTDWLTKASWSHYFYGVNLPALVGGSTAYVGFTGGTGALTAIENINGWTYLPSNTVTSPVNTY